MSPDLKAYGVFRLVVQRYYARFVAMYAIRICVASSESIRTRIAAFRKKGVRVSWENRQAE